MLYLLLFFLFLIAIYFYSTNRHDYWAKRNVKHDPPIPLFGNHLRNNLARKSIVEISVEMYNKYPDANVIGYYRGTTPELIIKDLGLIRQILNVDFGYFYKRGLGRDIRAEPLCLNLFHVEGDAWRLLRQRLTPAFTTAKLRAMFPLVVRCAEKLQRAQGDGGAYDARELMARFTTEFIGACGFGIEMDTINNELSQYREMGKLIFDRSLRLRVQFALWELFPELRRFLYVTNPKVEQAIIMIVKRIREQRDNKPSGRYDFIDILLEIEAKGKITGESFERTNADGTPMQVQMEMDLKSMVAQIYVFFAAGFETSSSATSFTLHTLAFYPEIQSKIQNEIDEVLGKYNNQLCYDAIAEMTLLDMAFKEAMRIFPSLGNLCRVCTKQYTIPGTNITLDPGVRILIPVQAIHMDAKYFDNPTEFRPERFAPDAVKGRHKYAYLPFGDGPRACIGARMGEMQSMAGMAAILHKFTVEPVASTHRNPKIKPTSNTVQSLQGGLPLNFRLRKAKPANKDIKFTKQT